MAPKQPAPSKPAKKKKPPPELGIGGVFGPTPAFSVKPTAKQQREAAAKLRKGLGDKQNDEVFAARQTRDVKAAITARVAAQHGLPDAKHPFSDVKSPALQPNKDRFATDETPKATLAAERRYLRQHGGLTAPSAPAPAPKRPVQPGERRPAAPQSKAEAALAALGTSRSLSFADKHQLPSELTRPAVRLSAADRDEILRGHFLHGETPASVNAKGRQQAAEVAKPSDPGVGFFMSQRPKGTYGQGTASLPGILGSSRFPNWIHRNLSIANIGEDIAGQADRLRPHPSGNFPNVDLREIVDAKVQAATPPGTRITPSDIASGKYGDYALGSEARKMFVELAARNGYNPKDAPRWNDSELAARAFTKNDKSFTGFARNLAADIGEQASLLALPAMIGSATAASIKDRSADPLLTLGQQFAEGWKNLLPVVGDRPWGENIYERPFSATTAVLPFAKGGSKFLGKRAGLADTREVTLQGRSKLVDEGLLRPQDARVRVPASQEPVTRLAQAGHDYFLHRATSKGERAQRPQFSSTYGNVAPELKQMGTDIPGRIGARLERRIERKGFQLQLAQARLEGGRDSHLALNNYFKAIRGLASLQALRRGGASQVAETAVRHSGFGSESREAVTYFHGEAKKSEERAQLFDEAARDAKREAATGHDLSLQERQQLHEDAQQYTTEAEVWRDTAKDQRTQAAWSEKNPFEHASGMKGEAQLVAAARAASREQGQLLKEAGILDEKGLLFGDLQHRMEIVHKIGDHSTHEWQVADELETLRQEHDLLRRTLHKQSADDLTELPASMDVRSPEAAHQLGRHRLAGLIYSQVQKRISERGRAAAERLRRHPDGQSPQRSLELRLGELGSEPVAAGRLTAAVQQTLFARQSNLHEHVADMETRVADMEAAERQTYGHTHDQRVRRAETRLKIAEQTDRSPVKLAAIRSDLEQAKQAASSDWKPSEKLLAARAQVEREALKIHGLGLGKQDIDNAIRVIPREVRSQIDPALIDDVVQQALDTPDLALLEKVSQSMLEDAKLRFEDLTGKDVAVARRFDVVSQRYLEKLREFKKIQNDQGRDPFHVRLHYPGTGSNLDPVRISSGEQFNRGKFSTDMHFYVAKDLEGLTRRKIEGKLYDLLAEQPVVVDAPLPGSIIPAGFFLVDRESYLNLRKVNRNAEEVRSMLEEWKTADARVESGARVPDNDQGSVLISRDLKEWIEDALGKGASGQEISGFLKATNTYRRWMLFSLPRTLVNNAIGNPILAMIQGAGIKTYIDSFHMLRQHPERLAHILLHRGPISNIMEHPTAKLTGPQAFWRHANAFQEDNGNLMVYLLHAKRAFKKENGLKWFQNVNKMDEHWGAFLEKAAKGEDLRVHEWSAKSAQMFGDMWRSFKHDNTLATLFLFHRWVGHMIYLTTVTMPAHMPWRTAFLQQTADLANQYRKEHGAWPEWAVSMIPLWDEVDTVLGKAQHVTWALSQGGANPFSTPQQTLDLGSVGQPKLPFQGMAAANLTPLFRVPAEILSGRRLDTFEPFTDQYGNAIGGVNWRLGAQQIIANTPILNTLLPRAGLSDDSIQLFDEHPRYTSASRLDPSMQAPRAMGRGFGTDWLLRLASALGVSVRPIDAAGPRSETTAWKTVSYQSQQATLRASRAGAAKLKKEIADYQRDPEAWRKAHPSGASP